MQSNAQVRSTARLLAHYEAQLAWHSPGHVIQYYWDRCRHVSSSQHALPFANLPQYPSSGRSHPTCQQKHCTFPLSGPSTSRTPPTSGSTRHRCRCKSDQTLPKPQRCTDHAMYLNLADTKELNCAQLNLDTQPIRFVQGFTGQALLPTGTADLPPAPPAAAATLPHPTASQIAAHPAPSRPHSLKA